VRNTVLLGKLKDLGRLPIAHLGHGNLGHFWAALHVGGVHGSVVVGHDGGGLLDEDIELGFVDDTEQVGEGLRGEALVHALNKVAFLETFTVVYLVGEVASRVVSAFLLVSEQLSANLVRVVHVGLNQQLVVSHFLKTT
jgi:hypothetical protein